MMMWLATMIQPEIFTDIDMEQEIQDYFQTYFALELTDADLDQILCTEMNSGRAGIEGD